MISFWSLFTALLLIIWVTEMELVLFFYLRQILYNCTDESKINTALFAAGFLHRRVSGV